MKSTVSFTKNKRRASNKDVLGGYLFGNQRVHQCHFSLANCKQKSVFRKAYFYIRPRPFGLSVKPGLKYDDCSPSQQELKIAT